MNGNPALPFQWRPGKNAIAPTTKFWPVRKFSSCQKIFFQKYKISAKNPQFWENLEAKLEFWAATSLPEICEKSARNLQLLAPNFSNWWRRGTSPVCTKHVASLSCMTDSCKKTQHKGTYGAGTCHKCKQLRQQSSSEYGQTSASWRLLTSS